MDRRTDHALRARVEAAVPEVTQAELEELGRACLCACGDVATDKCAGCGAFVCADTVGCIDAGEEVLCWRCARPLCREPGCPRTAGHPVTNTRGYCLAHHHADQARLREVAP